MKKYHNIANSKADTSNDEGICLFCFITCCNILFTKQKILEIVGMLHCRIKPTTYGQYLYSLGVATPNKPAISIFMS